MNLSKTSVLRPVATLMVILIAFGFGVMGLVNLQMDMLPNMNIPYAIVMTTYDGAGSEEIENLITKPVESAVKTISGIDEVTSQTNSGSSIVILKFNTDVDIDLAAVDIREKIDLVKGALPEDADDPMVMKLDINSMVTYQVNASSDAMDLEELYDLCNNDISDRLERVEGVASVSVSGGREKEIQVVVKQDKLRGYGISESTIASVLSSENANTPMGSMFKGNKDLSVRVKGEFESLDDINNIPVTTQGSSTIYVRDIADVAWVYEDAAGVSYTNGVQSIALSMQKSSNANTVNMSRAISKELESLREDMPDIDFFVVTDPSDMIVASINNVFSSLILGAVFAIIVLYIFLRNFKSTIIVALTMPLSVIVTFALMYFSGMTLNLMSLGGLVLGIGMLVDNSIVVLESIYKKIEEGIESKEAAIEGAREVVSSVVASTLTTVAVFVPISLVSGTVGQLFRALSFTIIFSLACSLIFSITFVPMASSVLLRPEDAANYHTTKNIFTIALDFIGNVISAIEAGYKKLLNNALAHKRITLLIVVIFIFCTGVTIPFMGFDFMPESDEGEVSITIDAPKGTRLEDTEQIAWNVVNSIGDINEIESIAFTVGGSGTLSTIQGTSTDSASITITLIGITERERSANDVAVEIRERVKPIAGADIEVSSSGSSMGSYSSSGIEIDIKGDNQDTLSSIGDDFVDIIKKNIPEASEVKTSLEDATPQATLKVNRAKASKYGISSSTISSIVKTAIDGTTATTYKLDGDEYDIVIQQDGDKINFLSDMESILIPTSTGANVPITEVCEIIQDTAPVQLTREDSQRYITVSAVITGAETSKVTAKVDKLLADYNMPNGYTWEYGGNTAEMVKQFVSLLFALLISIVLVYMVMAAQFEGFIYPFIVLFSIPVAMTAGLLGLFITGNSITITAFLGLIMLAGIVVNNAIVLIDYANLLRRERGMGIIEAIKVSGPARLRPILMSALTTIFGLVPMIVSQREGSEQMRGLAIVVAFGLAFSTLVTLVLVPVIYAGVVRRVERKRELREQKRKAKFEKRKSLYEQLKAKEDAETNGNESQGGEASKILKKISDDLKKDKKDKK